MKHPVTGEPAMRCAMCQREIGGLTGLDEVHNLMAHLAEHHDISMPMEEAIRLRNEWTSDT